MVIRASSNKGDVILDPFCGCATTCVQAEILNRKWIGIDIGIRAYELVKERLQATVPMFDEEIEMKTTPPKRGREDLIEKKFVYVMENPLLPGKYKVGISDNPEKRAKEVMAQAPKETVVIWQYKTAYAREIEKFVHQEFPKEKEWVEAGLDEIKEKIGEWKKSKII